MCGIIGGVSNDDIALKIVNSLKIIEYRGYDSANIITLTSTKQIYRHETIGQVQELLDLLLKNPISGNTGIGNTNWVRPNVKKNENINPHVGFDDIALVLNGIIENKKQIRDFLLGEGFELSNETDVELLGYLVYYFIQLEKSFINAVRLAENKLIGSYSVCFMLRDKPGQLIALRRGSSLVIGLGENENFMASDHLALLSFTNKFIYLEDGDIADIQQNEVTIYDEKNQKITRDIWTLDKNKKNAKKGKYSHFMMKDIFDQPDAVLSTLQGRLSETKVLIESFGKLAPELFERVQRVQIVAEGSAFRAALIGRYWIEEISGIPCEVILASENNYNLGLADANTFFITISQSGEEKNTLAALRARKYFGYMATLTIGNMPESTLVKESKFALITGEGPETIATSTKAFTAQLCALFLLAVALGQYHNLTNKEEEYFIQQLQNIPKKIQKTLEIDQEIFKLSKLIFNKKSILFFASDIQLPIAMEGASRISELSKIPATAYALYEMEDLLDMLADPEVSIITLVPVWQKLNKLMQEILRQAGNIFLFTDESVEIKDSEKIKVINLPITDRLLSPITFMIPMQLLAYHVSLLKGSRVDMPYYLV